MTRGIFPTTLIITHHFLKLKWRFLSPITVQPFLIQKYILNSNFQIPRKLIYGQDFDNFPPKFFYKNLTVGNTFFFFNFCNLSHSFFSKSFHFLLHCRNFKPPYLLQNSSFPVIFYTIKLFFHLIGAKNHFSSFPKIKNNGLRICL